MGEPRSYRNTPASKETSTSSRANTFSISHLIFMIYSSLLSDAQKDSGGNVLQKRPAWAAMAGLLGRKVQSVEPWPGTRLIPLALDGLPCR